MERVENMTALFDHIYVERDILTHPGTRRVLSRFPGSQVVEIRHYKDVFNRRHQNIPLQHRSRKLILAAKCGGEAESCGTAGRGRSASAEAPRLIYPGAPVCQDFGNDNFFYASCVMNCIFDCGYCYLKGMYPTGNLVVFVDIEHIFAELERLLEQKGRVYLCVSYDTDLLALEELTGFVEQWIRFTQAHPGLTIEVRTKCAATELIRRMPVSDRVIFAYTLSPRKLIRELEPGSGSLEGRLAAAAECLRRGVPTRLCFDPMLCVPGWRELYAGLFEETTKELSLERVKDFSVGTFRISTDYLKQMRKNYPDTAVIWYPFAREQGYCRYPKELAEEMENFAVEELRRRCPGARIFSN